MSKRKEEEIRRAIREMMQDNVMRLAIDGDRESREHCRQNEKKFLYLEIKDTNPLIQYIYDLSHIIYLGRSETGNQICIRDRMVSKHQGHIWLEDGGIYYADEVDAVNFTGIRRGIWTIRLKAGERIRLQTRDCLLVGGLRLKIRVFRGEQELFG